MPYNQYLRSQIPVNHFQKGDLTAARQRLAEIRFSEAKTALEAAQREFNDAQYKLGCGKVPNQLITPPYLLLAGWATKHAPGIASVTKTTCGDPEPGRSALDGYKHIGVAIDPAGWDSHHSNYCCKQRMGPAKPVSFSGSCAIVVSKNYSPTVSRIARAIDELKGCRFPTGDDGSNFKFCNKRRAAGSSYCAEHHTYCHAATSTVYGQTIKGRADKKQGPATPDEEGAGPF